MSAPSGISSHRIVLLIASIGLPLFALMMWATDSGLPLALWYRIPTASLAAFLLAGSYLHDGIRAHTRLGAGLIAVSIQLFFVHQGSVTGMGQSQVVGIMLITGLSVMLLRSPTEVIGFWLVSAVMATAFYRPEPTPDVPLPMFLTATGLLLGGLGPIHLARFRLQRELEHAQKVLEERVEQRTADLATEIGVRRKAQEQAQAASRAKSRFLENMSHELRTPLNAVIGYTELIIEEMDAGAEPAALKIDLDLVRKSARHLLTMIDDLLDLTRIEAGALQLNVASIELKPLVEEVVSGVRHRVAAGGNTVKIDVPEHLEVQSDALRLAQVLINLTVNAAKFTEGGTITLRAWRSDEGVHISVIDTGIGIAPEDIGRLFQRFVQLDDASTRVRGGTGLGLALSREIIGRLGGTITVASTPGLGSSFTVLLPTTAATTSGQLSLS